MRRASSTSAHNKTYGAVVVGAGPAGITAVGNLLERDIGRILWIDNTFTAGRVNSSYREVPSNTKVKTFVDYATAVAPFRDIISKPPQSPSKSKSESDAVAVEGGDKLQTLRQLNQERGCQLGRAADLCLMLTKGLRRHPRVIWQLGKVSSVEHSGQQEDSRWSVAIDAYPGTPTKRPRNSKGPKESPRKPITQATAQRVVFCTGSAPTNPPLGIDIPGLQNLDLDVALKPSLLTETLVEYSSRYDNRPLNVAVVGASHSAILVLMNLYNLAQVALPNLRIHWLRYDRPLKHAEYKDDWILYDNTGLKGAASHWAKANLENPKSEVMTTYLTDVPYAKGEELDAYAKALPGCDFYVQAVGYDRNPLPAVTFEGKEVTPLYNHERGSFEHKGDDSAEPTRLPGLYGAGIAFPNRVVDPYGNVEYAVGFWKFMKFVKAEVGGWN